MYAQTSRRHHSETTALARALRWFDAHQYSPAQIPSALRHWLLLEGSLTRHLIAVSAGDFRVERILQQWQRPTLSEARLLNIDPRQRALIREVILWGRDEPWVYARSVIPVRALRGDLRRLRQLRNSSLGALLFRYPQLRRMPFQLAKVDARALPAPLQAHAPLWARRSRFSIDTRALIVGEIFLDTFHQTMQARSPALHRAL
ncbi:MAG TPA: chorismate lyase [Spongiibacteraceae bacterium]